MTLMRDDNAVAIVVFAPIHGVTLSGTVTPTDNRLVKLGADVTITIDSIDVSYSEGDIIGLRKNVSYTFSASTVAHEM